MRSTIRALVLLAALCAAGAFADDVDVQTKFVWAHTLPTFPLDLSLYRHYKPLGYGGLYPLAVRESFDDKEWQVADVRDAKAAGVNGFAVDVFTDAKAIRPYLAAADQVGGFQIAPCLDLSLIKNPEDKPAAAIKTLEDYADFSKGHPSAARVRGKLIIFTYGTSSMPPDEWDRVRKAIRQDGVQTYWVADAIGDGSLGARQLLRADDLEPNLRPFEAGYVFGNAASHWSGLVGLFKNLGKPFDGGMMPGYDRAGGGFIDPRGTALYRSQWKKLLSGGANWTVINTWNDLNEASEIMPTSDWSTTRSDITRWYSAEFRGEPAPFQKPKLYITSPKALYLGDSGTVEGLILNGADHAVHVKVELVDGNGVSLHQSDERDVLPGEVGAASLQANFAKLPAKRFARARVSVSDGSGLLQEAVGAPIVVADRNEVPGLRLSYYSVPADRALPASAITQTVNDAGQGVPDRVAVRSDQTHRFMELLRNNAQVGNYADEARHNQDLNQGGERLSGPKWGFYVSRLIDENGKVAYSDPVYVAPPADIDKVADYVFDGSSKTSLKDKSLFGRTATYHGIDFSTVEGKACGEFDGVQSFVSLPPGQTPDGPSNLTVVVRPGPRGGTIFADTGGLILRLDDQGRPALQRKSGSGWCFVQSATAISGWATIQVTYRDGELSLMVDGRKVASKPCQSGFASNKAAIGCNPFGKGSSFFDGQIAELSITRIQP